MAFSFFNLPSNILSNIYNMDSTFRDKFKDQINTQIWEKSYDMFRKKLIKQSVFDDTPIIARKLDVFIQYLINNNFLKENIPDQISIYTSWKNLQYENNTISVDDTGYNSIDQGLFVNVSSDDNDNVINIFRGEIYTTEQYNDIFCDIIGRDNIGCDLNYGDTGGYMVFKNNDFVIVKCNDYDDNYDDYNYNYEDYDDSGDAWMYAPEDEY